MGHGIWVFPLRFGLGSGFLVVSFGWAGGVLGWTPLFFYWGFFGVIGISFSFLFTLSLVCGGLGVLDHGAGLVCFSFSFRIHYLSWLDIPDFVHFVFDGPLHCRKVEQRFQTS